MSSTVVSIWQPGAGPNEGKDARIFSSNPNANVGADGTLQIASAGANLQRSLIEFDLFSPPNIEGPALTPESEIISAKLYLTCFTSLGAGEDVYISLHEITQAWVEGNGTNQNPSSNGVSWSRRTVDLLTQTPIPWTNAGGDFVADPLATVLAPDEPGVLEIDVLSAAQIAIAGGRGAGNGIMSMIAKLTKEEGIRAFQFHARESGESSVRPKLVVESIPPGGGAAVVMPGASLAAMIASGAVSAAYFQV